MSIRSSRRAPVPPLDTTSGKRTNARRVAAARARPRRSMRGWRATGARRCRVAALDEFQQIHVCTQNTLYELIVDQRAAATSASAAAATSPTGPRRGSPAAPRGGSFLKRLTISLGLQMEIESDGRRIVTSPVRTIALLEHRGGQS